MSIIDSICPPTRRLYRARAPGGARIQCDLRDPVQRSIFYCGTYELALSRVLLQELSEGDTFLDIGANVGFFSFLAASRVGTTGRVLAFEPSRDLCGRLKEITSRRAGHLSAAIEVYDVALSDSDGEAVLSWAIDNRYGERFLSDEGPGEKVHTVSLATYFPDLRPDIVKIDVEGAELRVLRGMEGQLRAGRPRLVVVEAIEDNVRRFGDSCESIIAFMEDAGYSASHVVSPFCAPMLAFRPSTLGSIGFRAAATETPPIPPHRRKAD